MCCWVHKQCECVCVCACACQYVWRQGRRVLWLAGVMPAPAERWAELLASSPICPPIMEQSARPDNALSAAASHGSHCPLLPSHPLLPYPHRLHSSSSSLCTLSLRLIGILLSPFLFVASFLSCFTNTVCPLHLHPSSILFLISSGLLRV